MPPEDFSTLELARFELRLRARESATLPPFLGSTLRGAFGHALKQTVCVMPHRDCQRCLVAGRCIYPYLFETPAPQDIPQLRGQQQAPHPFILSPPAPGSPPASRATPASFAARPAAVGSSVSAANRARPTQATPVLRKAATRDPASPVAAETVAVPSFTPLNAPLNTARGRPLMPASLGGRGESARRAGPDFAANDKAAPSLDRRLNLGAGDEIAFGLLLMGRAIEYLPYMVYAVSEMSRRGLGADRARFELADVFIIDARGGKRQVYSGASQRMTTPDDSAIKLSSLIETRLGELRSAEGFSGDSLALRFVTPTRIRVEGDLQAGMSFELLVRNLLRRVSLLSAVHGGAPLELDYRGLIERAATVRTISSRLGWCDWERYSNRQQTKMKLGGFIGEIEYGGEILGEFLSLMVMGEVLHVGGGTSFGLGRLQIGAEA